MEKTILVTGAKGQLGSEIEYLSSKQPNSFLFTDIDELDITRPEAISAYFLDHKIDLVINCAAYTAVDKAEEEKGLADSVNHLGPRYLAEAAKKINAHLFHLSTECVFDGRSSEPYMGEDDTNPLSVYGKTKLAGEEEALKSGKNTVVIRTSWLYSSFGSNFVKTIVRLSQERESIGVVNDQIGTPTYARDLAGILLHMINTGDIQPGIFHYSNEGVTSWYEFAKTIVEMAGIKCNIYPIQTHQYPAAAKRLPYGVLNKDKIKSVYKMNIPYWKDSLQECISLL